MVTIAIMEMSTNAGIVSGALKFVSQSQQKIDTLKKTDEGIEVTRIEEKAIEGVH